MGLTRVRNEALIIKDTLDHFAAFCDAGIVVFDDCSTDDTAEIMVKHPAVVKYIGNPKWQTDRTTEEWRHRQIVLDAGREFKPDWFLYFDADERIEWDGKVPDDCDSVAMRLFDAYITEEDKDVVGTERRWFGPEYRDIVMLYRNAERMSYYVGDQRIVAGLERTAYRGFVRHYGKALSVEHWEETCDYYIAYFPESYKRKWRKRKGHAVHDASDFGRALMLWEERAEKGVQLAPMPKYAVCPRDLQASRQKARPSYLCPDCGDPLRTTQMPDGLCFLMCPRGCRYF